MGLNVIAQSFLQWMMAEKVLTTTEAIKQYNQCVDNANGREASKLRDSDGLEHQVGKINSQLEFVEFQIKNMYSPWDDETYWGLCNTIEDESSRVGTHLTKGEVELFFAIMDELREFEGEMDLVEAQNVSTQRQLPVAENGRVIQKLSQLHWLKVVRHQGEKPTLTPGGRAILELPKVRQWVRQIGKDKRQRERGQAKSQPEVEEEDGEEEEEEEEDEGSEDEVRRGRKRRSSQASPPDEMEVDEVEEELTPSRKGSQPRAVRRGTRRSGRTGR